MTEAERKELRARFHPNLTRDEALTVVRAYAEEVGGRAKIAAAEAILDLKHSKRSMQSLMARFRRTAGIDAPKPAKPFA